MVNFVCKAVFGDKVDFLYYLFKEYININKNIINIKNKDYKIHKK